MIIQAQDYRGEEGIPGEVPHRASQGKEQAARTSGESTFSVFPKSTQLSTEPHPLPNFEIIQK